MRRLDESSGLRILLNPRALPAAKISHGKQGDMRSGISPSVASQTPSPVLNPTRVFVVDRDPTRQQRFRQMMEEEGLECCGEAAEAAEAVDCIGRTAPHVVLASLSMTCAS